MNQFLIIIFSFLFIGCTKNVSSVTENEKTEIEEEIKEEDITNEEKLMHIYKQLVKPLFEKYNDVEIPATFKIDTTDLSINAGASFGYVEVSQGLVNSKKEAIQVFTLAHELAHIITLKQASIFNLEGAIPRGTLTNDYKKAEYLADLIAVHLMKTKLPGKMEVLIKDFNYLENLLGAEIFTHPSGEDRIKSINKYLKNSTAENNEKVFRNNFVEIWHME